MLEPGDYLNGVVNTVVEIPKGSMLKVEWDRKRACFMLDRVDPGIFAKPCNYGFIPQTLDEDGDELDTLIVTEEPIQTGVWLEAKIVGILNFIDDGEADHKVVVVPADDRHTGNSVNSLDDLGERWKQMIEHHFSPLFRPIDLQDQPGRWSLRPQKHVHLGLRADTFAVDANHDIAIEQDDLPTLIAAWREREANLVAWEARDANAEWTAQWWFADNATLRVRLPASVCSSISMRLG